MCLRRISPQESPTSNAAIYEKRSTMLKFNDETTSISPRYSDFSFGEVDEEDLHAVRQLVKSDVRDGFIEHEPGHGQVGATDAQFGGGVMRNRRGDDELGFGVPDEEWDEINEEINLGMDDNDLNIHDRIEKHLENTRGMATGLNGMDLPVAEMNDLMRQFSTRNKSAIFQEEGMDGDVEGIHDGQESVKMTGLHKMKRARNSSRIMKASLRSSLRLQELKVTINTTRRTKNSSLI